MRRLSRPSPLGNPLMRNRLLIGPYSKDYSQCRTVDLGGVAVSYEQGSPVPACGMASVQAAALSHAVQGYLAH